MRVHQIARRTILGVLLLAPLACRNGDINQPTKFLEESRDRV